MGCCDQGTCCYRFWTDRRTVIALTALNVLGFLGWITGAIYVTATGQNSKLWFWSMPWMHVGPFYWGYRYAKKNNSDCAVTSAKGGNKV